MHSPLLSCLVVVPPSLVCPGNALFGKGNFVLSGVTKVRTV
jgi:hypothetical protein